HASTSLAAVAPAMVALGAGSASDLLVVYVDASKQLYGMGRDSVRGAWSAAPNSATAFSNDAPALAPMTNGRAMLVYRGQNGLPYFSVFDPSRGLPWSVPAPLVAASNPAIASPPSVASGACGDDAGAAYVVSAGAGMAT